MNIATISRDFVYDYRAVIVPITTAYIPAAIESIRLFKGIYENPNSVKKNLKDFRDSISSAFLKKEDESQASFHKRWKFNATITSIGTFIIAGTLSAPFLILPAAFAIPAALSTTYIVGKLFHHFYHHPIPIGKIKDGLKDAFKQRKQETIQDFQERRCKAIGKILLCSIIFGASLGVALSIPYIFQVLSQVRSVWELADFLPFQTKGVAFTEYAMLGLLHISEAFRHWIKSDSARSVSHLSCAIAAFFFPLWYLLVPGSEMRIHHSFIGLLFQLAPSQTVRTFGTFITADSALYCFSPERGALLPNNVILNYDYMNAVYDNFPKVLQNLTGIFLFEKFIDFILQKPITGHVQASSNNEATESSFASSLPETTYISSGSTPC